MADDGKEPLPGRQKSLEYGGRGPGLLLGTFDPDADSLFFKDIIYQVITSARKRCVCIESVFIMQIIRKGLGYGVVSVNYK